METIHRIIIEINQSLSDYVLLFLLLGAGLWFSFKTRFVQIRFFKEGMKRFFSGFSGKKEKHEGGMSSFQALATAIAAQVGTGNIVGASGAILTGGTRRLAGVMETFVPVMAGVFLLGALAVLLMNITKLPTAIGLIFKYAFSPQAIIGGSFGAALKTALSQGAKRGLFSNEAGMGTTPHAHAQAMVDNPHQQGIVLPNVLALFALTGSVGMILKTYGK